MPTTNTKLELNWENLLTEAVTKPGKILAACNLFHNYSLGNAMLALIQCEVRGIHPGPINTFPGRKALRRHVLKGQKAISLVMPIAGKKRYEENQQAADSDDSRKSECFTRFVFRPNWFVLSQTEGDDVAAPHAGQLAHRPLDVAGVIVPAADDDDVLDAPADEEATADEVAEVPRVQPGLPGRIVGQRTVGLRRELGLLEVAARHARPAGDDLAHLPLAEPLPGVVDDGELVAGECATAAAS